MLSRRLLRIKVVKALYAHFNSDSDSLITSQKNLITSVDKTYDLYHQMLWLIVDVMRYGEKRIELAQNKKLPTKEDRNPNRKFIENHLIRQIETSEKLGDYITQRGLGWVQYPELIKNLYTSLVESDYYQAYMANKQRSFKEDVKLVEDFYLNEVEDNDKVEEVLEEQSIFWSDDMDFALILAIRTITSAQKEQTDLPLSAQYKNSDDIEFFKELFTKSIVNYTEYLSYIEKFTQNWDIERVAFMDHIIMVAAIAEMINFDSIPIKVTLDEYIEISKYYSTPSSSNFINGVLDRVIETLVEENKIKKTGRGLL